MDYLLQKERERDRMNDFYKKPDLYGFSFEFHQMLKDEIVPALYKIVLKIDVEKILLRWFYKFGITLIPNVDNKDIKDITIKSNYRWMSLINMDEKFLTEVLENQIRKILKG